MRYPRLIAVILGLLAFVACAGLARADAPVLGVLAGFVGVGIIAIAAMRPISKVSRRRLTLAFPGYAAAMVLIGLGALFVMPAAAAATWFLAAFGLSGWLIARRQSRHHQRALMYMGYIRD